MDVPEHRIRERSSVEKKIFAGRPTLKRKQEIDEQKEDAVNLDDIVKLLDARVQAAFEITAQMRDRRFDAEPRHRVGIGRHGTDNFCLHGGLHIIFFMIFALLQQTYLR
jgi:hypothetical protein